MNILVTCTFLGIDILLDHITDTHLRWLNRAFWPREEWARKLARALKIAILASPYSDDVSAIEVKKKKLLLQISQISFGEIP